MHGRASSRQGSCQCTFCESSANPTSRNMLRAAVDTASGPTGLGRGQTDQTRVGQNGRPNRRSASAIAARTSSCAFVSIESTAHSWPPCGGRPPLWPVRCGQSYRTHLLAGRYGSRLERRPPQRSNGLANAQLVATERIDGVIHSEDPEPAHASQFIADSKFIDQWRHAQSGDPLLRRPRRGRPAFASLTTGGANRQPTRMAIDTADLQAGSRDFFVLDSFTWRDLPTSLSRDWQRAREPR